MLPPLACVEPDFLLKPCRSVQKRPGWCARSARVSASFGSQALRSGSSSIRRRELTLPLPVENRFGPPASPSPPSTPVPRHFSSFEGLYRFRPFLFGFPSGFVRFDLLSCGNLPLRHRLGGARAKRGCQHDARACNRGPGETSQPSVCGSCPRRAGSCLTSWVFSSMRSWSCRFIFSLCSARRCCSSAS